MDWGECGLGRCVIVGRIPYWVCKSNLCGADLEGGGASNLTGADRGRMWIGAVSPASSYSTAVSGEPTCRAPNGNFLGNRPVGPPTPICWGADRSSPERQTADLSAPQRQFAGEPTGLLPNAR